MTLVLILPATRQFCPYAELYTKVLGDAGISFVVVEWDRMSKGKPSGDIYRTRKSGHRRGIIDYLRYASFAKKRIREHNSEQVIVFGLPMLMSLSYLRALKGIKYAVDIRDYHFVYKIPRVRSATKAASLVTVASPGFLSWLDRGVSAAVSHNATGLLTNGIQPLKTRNNYAEPAILKVGTIGQIKDLNAQKLLLAHLGKRANILLKFDGEGAINNKLEAYCACENITNVAFTGLYMREKEGEIYRSYDFVSMIMSQNSLNNQTLLANRLYNSVLFGVPIFSVGDSYLSSVLSKFQIGVAFSDPLELETVRERLRIFNKDREGYDAGRVSFLKWVREHQEDFEKTLQQRFLLGRIK